jgi:hypothetical protein
MVARKGTVVVFGNAVSDTYSYSYCGERRDVMLTLIVWSCAAR